MKNRKIEKMLISAGDKFVPNVLNKVMENSASQYEYNQKTIVLKNNNKKAIVAVAILTAFLLFAGMLTSGFYLNSDDSFVYVDINPSIVLVLNKMGNVKSVKNINADAETLLAGQSLKGLNFENAVEQILKLSIKQKYINANSDDNQIMLSIYNNDLKKSDKQMEKITKCANQLFESSGVKCKIDKETGNKKENGNGVDQGVSPGKLKVIKSIISINPSYTIESLKNYSMKELRKILNDLTK